MSVAGIDLVSALPVEIVEKIFGYLVGRELAACSGVNRKWYACASSEFLWKRVCQREYPEELRFIRYPERKGIYKECYMRALRCEKKWEINQYWRMEVEEAALIFEMGNGGVVGVVKPDSSICLFDLNSEGTSETLQEIPPFINSTLGAHDLRFFAGGNRVTFSHGNAEKSGVTLYTFTWENNTLLFHSVLHCVRDPVTGAGIRQGLGNPAPGIGLQDYCADSLVFHDSATNTDFFCDWSQMTGKVKRPENSGGCYSYGNTYFLYTTLYVLGYDKTGCEKIRLEIGDLTYQSTTTRDVTLHFNKEVIVVSVNFDGVKKAVGWLLGGGRLPPEVATRHDLALHPQLRRIIYIAQPDRNEDKYEIITVCLDTGDIVTKVEFSLGLKIFTNYVVGYFTIENHRYALYSTFFGGSLMDKRLVDLKKGRVISRGPADMGSLEHFGRKFIKTSREGQSGNRIHTLIIFT